MTRRLVYDDVTVLELDAPYYVVRRVGAAGNEGEFRLTRNEIALPVAEQIRVGDTVPWAKRKRGS